MQHEVTTVQKLLDHQGNIAEPGWARKPVWKYSRNDIQTPLFRSKEWDYYLVTNGEVGAAFTISDLGYVGMASVSLLDFKKRKHYTKTDLYPLPLGRFKLGKTSRCANAGFHDRRMKITYGREKGYRTIKCYYKKFLDDENLAIKLCLKEMNDDSMCIATPWESDPQSFYYNQKINCMPAKGKIKLGNKEWILKEDSTMGTLDWGRGVWTYENTWYWGTASGWLAGVRFGFNLGYGFSDRSSATENVIFYDGKVHKLEEVIFKIPRDENGKRIFTEPWKIVSSDGRFEGGLRPIFDRAAKMDYKIIATDQHQIFGYFTGKVVLDDRTVLDVKDFLCAVEVVHNKY